VTAFVEQAVRAYGGFGANPFSGDPYRPDFVQLRPPRLRIGKLRGQNRCSASTLALAEASF
jgi:hypothetical protein